MNKTRNIKRKYTKGNTKMCIVNGFLKLLQSDPAYICKETISSHWGPQTRLHAAEFCYTLPMCKYKD